MSMHKLRSVWMFSVYNLNRAKMTMYRPVFADNDFRTPNSHYEVRIGGKRLLYTYIRKNACSSFKRIINRKPHPKYFVKNMLGREEHGRNHISGNMKYYLRQNDADLKIDKYDETVFVYRDPVERFISVFTNKFIDNFDKPTAADIRANFEKLSNMPAGDATFIDFIKYSENDFSLLDCHLWPQKSHLWEIDYSLPISIERLQDEMSECIGRELAQKWFGKRVNASKTKGIEASQGFENTTVNELRKIQSDGVSISKNNFVFDGLNDYLADRYRMDVDMISAIGKE